MLKSKLNKIFFIFISIVLIYFNFVFCKPNSAIEDHKKFFEKKKYVEQGLFIEPDFNKDIDTGMLKLDIAGFLGKPFIVNKEANSWCYCYYESDDFRIRRFRYLLLFFNKDDVLFDIEFVDLYGDN